jgi:hypothetical protein
MPVLVTGIRWTSGEVAELVDQIFLNFGHKNRAKEAWNLLRHRRAPPARE